MRWRPVVDAYEFDTGKIFGNVRPFSHYHGVSGLAHRSFPVDLVRPENALLNAEYYIRPGSGRTMVPRALSAERRTTHELMDGSVHVHFPPEPEFQLKLDLTYSVRDDAVDMEMAIDPGMDVPGFEIFFASYVCEALEETWVPLSSPDGSQDWKRLSNRGQVGGIFGIVRDVSMREQLPDAYPDLPVDVEDRPFSEPILVARDSTLGLALVFLCDPGATRYLAGQYHGWDTAHDWSFGADLAAGEPVGARVRLICRPFKDVDAMFDDVVRLWEAFAGERAH